MTGRALVMAKAPVAGQVKTRLGAVIGMDAAAEIAAAALLDTIDACWTAFGRECVIALDGDLGEAVAGAEIAAALTGWTVIDQHGRTFGARLARAHQDAAAPGRVVVQVGMDTPQVSAAMLRSVVSTVGPGVAALGPAEDGGWWVLAVADETLASVLADVPMSTPQTYDVTVAALLGSGARLRSAPVLRDVDTVADAIAVASLAPTSRFAQAWMARAGAPV